MAFVRGIILKSLRDIDLELETFSISWNVRAFRRLELMT